MLGCASTAAILGIETYLVNVEADCNTGMPSFEMVGYLGSEVKEAKERIRTALRNSGFKLPAKKFVINLSPGDLRKLGVGFDLAIAMAILVSIGEIEQERINNIFFVGEIGLNGLLNKTNGILAVVDFAAKLGFEFCMIPKEAVNEAIVVDGIKILGISSLTEAVECIKGNRKYSVFCDKKEFVNVSKNVDFAEVRGQLLARRAAEIAAAGFHNMLMIGPPGAGKSMIAKRIPSIMPPISKSESIEVSKIHSICGLLPAETALMEERPFRSPHHTISLTAMTGGGMYPRPGEITLANRGVLFLDELTEFRRDVLETMRQPLEDGYINIVRQRGTYCFPSKILFIGALNPCLCGYYPNRKRCNCNEAQVRKHLSKISRPIIDRMDICIELLDVDYDTLIDKCINESSEQIRKRVNAACDIQAERYKDINIKFNAELSHVQVEKMCSLEKDGEDFLKQIFASNSFSARAYHKILKLSRTIADLEGAEQISVKHLSEAVCYRNVDRKYWGHENR